jgi:glycosyltransferase involved in cell wall biosynthesis
MNQESSQPRVSVIICTFNRCRDLASALDAVLAQEGAAPHEVIVVDNNSTDDTRSLVEARQKDRPRLRYVFEPSQGLPQARNTGILAARAPLIAFTDDDIIVAPDWVASVERAFEQFPDADCVGGPVLPIWPASGRPEWFTWLQTAPVAIQNKGDKPMFVTRDNAAPCLMGANFSFRRSAFDKTGLFSHDFSRSQDRELQLRLWKAGGIGVYVPDVVTHVPVPEERLTKAYYRLWFSRAGRFHSRMGLLEVIDRDGRMVELPRPEHCLLGLPPYLYRQLVEAVTRAMWGSVRRDRVASFYHENRARYLASYIRERWRREAVTFGRALTDVARFVRARLGRASAPGSTGAVPGGAA